MAHALRLARRGLGNVWPNPAVGCVLIRDNRVVGRGWTQPGGRPHAERMALDQAGDAARGATAYVTLEPCAHHGKTPPCADALVAAGVIRVVGALTDPDRRVAGRGYAILRAAGIAVTEPVRQADARELQAGFLSRVTRGRPLVTLKLATSFDARIATAHGQSQWITGPQARTHVHLLRMQHDAIMVGGNTARTDRPALNVRGFGSVRQPLRIIVSTRSLPPLPDEDDQHGPLLRVEGDPAAYLAQLAEKGATRIFCEGGGTLAASLLAYDLVDQIVAYTAGITIGDQGLAAIAALPDLPLADMPRFHLTRAHPIGPDLFHMWQRA